MPIKSRKNWSFLMFVFGKEQYAMEPRLPEEESYLGGEGR